MLVQDTIVRPMNVVVMLHGVQQEQQLQNPWQQTHLNPGKILYFPLVIAVPHVQSDSSSCLSAIPDSPVRPRILGGKLDNEDIKNVIPEPVATPSPKIRQQPFDYDGEVYIGAQTEEKREDEFPQEEEEEEEEEEGEDNQLSPRGDVFSKCPFRLAPLQ